MIEISKKQFIEDVTVTKMKRKELAAKYQLPETEIKKIMKNFGLKISRKQHETYTIVDDTVATETPVEIAPETEIVPEVETLETTN